MDDIQETQPQLSSKETKLIQEAELLLCSKNIDVLQNIMNKLLSAYKKQLNRTHKLITSSDKQQEKLLKLNEKLEEIQHEQSLSISKMIEDRRTNVKNIIENKKKIFEIHKQEILKRQADIDELTTILVQKDEALLKLNAYAAENQRLKRHIAELEKNIKTEEKQEKEFSRDVLKDFVSILAHKHKLEYDILQTINKLLKRELNFSKIDNNFFSNSGLKLIQKNIQSLLNSYDTALPSREISIYIVSTYLDDILEVCADKLIDLLGQRDMNAKNFIAFYDGQTSLTLDGIRIEKPEIRSSDGIKWNVNNIYQVATQYKNLTNKIGEKEKTLAKLSASLGEMSSITSQIEEQIVSYEEGDLTHKTLLKLQNELANTERLLEVASGSQKEELEEKIQKLNGSIRTLRLQSFGGRSTNSTVAKEIDKLATEKLAIDQDLSSIENTVAIEQKKLEQLHNVFNPIEKRHSMVVAALAKAMAQFELQQTNNNLF